MYCVVSVEPFSRMSHTELFLTKQEAVAKKRFWCEITAKTIPEDKSLEDVLDNLVIPNCFILAMTVDEKYIKKEFVKKWEKAKEEYQEKDGIKLREVVFPIGYHPGNL